MKEPEKSKWVPTILRGLNGYSSRRKGPYVFGLAVFGSQRSLIWKHDYSWTSLFTDLIFVNPLIEFMCNHQNQCFRHICLHLQIGKHLEWRTITAETNRIRLWRLFQLSHCSSVSFLRTLQGHLSHICVTLRVCTSTALKWPRCKAETLSRIGKRKVVIGLTGKTQVLDKIHSGTSCCAVDCEVNVDDSTTLLKESGL